MNGRMDGRMHGWAGGSDGQTDAWHVSDGRTEHMDGWVDGSIRTHLALFPE